jgi:hypothetical protein
MKVINIYNIYNINNLKITLTILIGTNINISIILLSNVKL